MKPPEKMKDKANLLEFLRDTSVFLFLRYAEVVIEGGEARLDCHPGMCGYFIVWAEKKGLMTPQEAAQERQWIEDTWAAELAEEWASEDEALELHPAVVSGQAAK